MKIYNRQTFVCATFDSFLVLFVAFFVAYIADGTSPFMVITEKWNFLLAIIMPISLLIGWRGGVHASRLTNGNRGWLQPAIEGFCWGFVFLPASHAIGIINEVFAAGPPWPTPGYSSLKSGADILVFCG